MGAPPVKRGECSVCLLNTLCACIKLIIIMGEKEVRNKDRTFNVYMRSFISEGVKNDSN